MVGRRGTEGEGESILSRLHAQQEGQKSPARGSEIISKRVRIKVTVWGKKVEPL